MKRKIVAGAGVAILSFTALPFTGVFAAEGGASVVDTVSVTVLESCQMEADTEEGTVNWQSGMAGEDYGAKNGTEMRILCNTNKGWSLNVNASELVNQINHYAKIPFGPDSKSNGSVWSAKLDVEGTDGAYEVIAGWDSFAAAKVNDATAVRGITNGEVVVRPEYKAYVGDGQASGFYEGTIVYSFVGGE